MNRLFTFTGIGATIGAAAIAGGLGVAFAHDDNPGKNRMMDGGTMQMGMDPAAMQRHMKDVFGDETYARMQEAMTTALGDEGYQQMLTRMATGCSQAGMGMVTPGAGPAPAAPGHSGHHPETPATN